MRVKQQPLIYVCLCLCLCLCLWLRLTGASHPAPWSCAPPRSVPRRAWWVCIPSWGNDSAGWESKRPRDRWGHCSCSRGNATWWLRLSITLHHITLRWTIPHREFNGEEGEHTIWERGGGIPAMTVDTREFSWLTVGLGSFSLHAGWRRGKHKQECRIAE